MPLMSAGRVEFPMPLPPIIFGLIAVAAGAVGAKKLKVANDRIQAAKQRWK